MALWVTHLIIADRVMEACPWLDRRGFCVGSIAPDCNVENEDWTAFTPSREVTHWMTGQRKTAADSGRFCQEYILNRRTRIKTNEEYSFLLGYYAHLITDGEFQRMIRDEARVKAVWERIKADSELRERAAGMAENWDSVKKLIPKQQRLHEMHTMEAEYLQSHPDSGYLTEILPLKEFPDYIDYLPHGCIVRKIGVMGFVPEIDEKLKAPIGMSRAEFWDFTEKTAELTVRIFREKGFVTAEL